MNHAEMSDFEINKAVFLKLKIDYEDFDFNPFPDNCTSFSYGDGANWHEFDACNNPSDAWPIIDGIIKSDCIVQILKAGVIVALAGGGRIQCMHKNPLRAAMIVFLMMNEDK